MQSDTPRTDQQREMATGMNYMTDFARELERELAAAKAELVRKADELNAAIKQRDEARRTLCEEWAKDGLPFDWKGRRDAMGMADLLKWDCFKEGGGA